MLILALMDSSIFPTSYSTLSATALNKSLQQAYGFSDSTCRLLIRNVSDTYVLKTGSGKFIFKIYRDSHRKIEEIKGEIELLLLLSSKDAKVAGVIKAKNGTLFQAFNAAEGIRYGVLFKFAEGKVIAEMNKNQLAVLGSEMAKVHSVTENLQLVHERKKYDIETTITQPINTLAKAFEQYEVLDEYHWLQKTAKKVVDKLHSFKTSAFSYGYCHYDFLPKNFHFGENDELTFFDFDFAGQGFLANDITIFHIHTFLEATYQKITRTQADQMFEDFIQAYRNIKPFSTEEQGAIPYLGFGFWVFYLGFHYENFEDWSNSFFGTKFLKERIALIKTWMEYTTGENWD